MGYIVNIEGRTKNNKDFREVLYTSKNMQLVVMMIEPKKDIGEETHQLDQFIRIEEGYGEAILDRVIHKISAGFAIVIPSGTLHNIVNTSNDEQLKLYTVYAPPEHLDKTVRHTRSEADSIPEHYDGHTTE